MNHRLSILAGLISILCAPLYAAPGLLNYQGRLTDAAGQPVTTSVDVTFTFWDAENGGAQLGGGFSDMDTVTPDADGIYATLIGDEPGTLVPESVFDVESVWLNVNIGGEDLVPRLRITSVGYALKSSHADIATTAVAAVSAVNAANAATAGNADALDGRDASDFAAAVHGHNLQDLAGAVTDAQVPNTITIDYAATAGTATNATNATNAANATNAVNADTVDSKHASDFATAAHSHNLQDLAGAVTDGQIPATITRDSELSAGLATKSDTGHGHYLQDLSGAVTDAQIPAAITRDAELSAGLSTKANAADVVAKAGDTMTGALNVTGSYIGIGQAAAPATPADKLYNVGGTLQWNGSPAYHFPSEIVTATTQMAANRGYIANSASQLTLTLPVSVSLKVGDVIRVSGIGNGGWMVAQNAGQSILKGGLTGTDFSSGWRDHMTDSLRIWTGVACSADGMKLAATARGYNICTSADGGATWIQRSVSSTWRCIASSADGTRLFAGTENDTHYISTDSGASWSARPNPDFMMMIEGAAMSADGNTLLVMGMGEVAISRNGGGSWTTTTISPGTPQRAAMSSDTTRMVLGCWNGYLYTSTDSGNSWTSRMTDAQRLWAGVASSSDGSKLVACNKNGYIYTSTDSGVSWTPRMTDATRFWTDVASSADGNFLTAVMLGGQIYHSTDAGVTWTTIAASRDYVRVASSDDGLVLIAGVSGGTWGYVHTFNGAFTTPGTLGYLSGQKHAAVELLYVGNDAFLPISHEGLLNAY